MVYKYKRKTSRANWEEEAMASAMREVLEGDDGKKLSIRSAAAKYNIPYPTLRKHIVSGSTRKTVGRFRPTFSQEYETQLVQYLHKIEACFYGLTKNDLQSLAFQLAERNGLQHSFKNERAGDQWAANFLKRHRDLALRAPESTSIAQAQGFNDVAVGRFFDLLRKLLDKHKFVLNEIQATTSAKGNDGELSTHKVVSPEDVKSYPKKERVKTNSRKRKKQQSEVLTSRPFKSTLQNRPAAALKKTKSDSVVLPRRKLKRKLFSQVTPPQNR